MICGWAFARRRLNKTTKAYLAGIGTTGILVGSIVLLLVLGSGILAFHGLPDLGREPAPLERVVLQERGQADTQSDRTRLVAAAADRSCLRRWATRSRA